MSKSKKDSLGDRMKENYENVNRYYLTRRTPVIIRLDGKAFHTFTRGMRKPFDDILVKTMQDTMKYLCENVQGCVLGYTQSDEITLVLVDYATLTTSAWYDNNVIKMCSVAASMATLAFNKSFRKYVTEYGALWDSGLTPQSVEIQMEHNKYMETLTRKFDNALFDARAFNIPKEEVTNCLVWRQQDAIRNSIEAAGFAHFSPKELHKKSCAEIKDMLFYDKNISWEDYPATYKNGCCCVKESYIATISDNPTDSPVVRTHWIIDEHIPIFTQDRDYVERRI